MTLEGKNALVTGGASGIGRAICFRLARDGAGVAILDQNGKGAEEVSRAISAIGRQAIARECDVASGAGAAAAVARARGALERIHILVNSAGIGGRLPFPEMSVEAWDRMIAIHLGGTFHSTRAVIDDMLAAGWGRIVNVSSIAALRGGQGLVHYASAKAGMLGFTKALALEVASRGITVNAIACGLIDTPMVRQSPRAEAFLAETARDVPVGRVGRPEDIAAACAYLVSEEAGFVTGQVVSPNGGAYL
jgi:2-hydroxycyclohexanecarboxyl-CoA dehydrogenase